MRKILILILVCAGCAGTNKKMDITLLDEIDKVENKNTRNENTAFEHLMVPKSGNLSSLSDMESKQIPQNQARFKVELLDSMSLYEFLLAILSPIQMNLIMDSSIEMNVSCNINSELSEQEIKDIIGLLCRSLSLECVMQGINCTVSKQIPNYVVGKAVFAYQTKFIKNSQYLIDTLKTFEGVTVLNQGRITLVIAEPNEIGLIQNVLESLDRDIFTGYVYSFIVCNDSKNYIDNLKSILLGINARYEEEIQIIKITENVILVLSMSGQYLKQIEMICSMLDSYISKDLQVYSIKVRFRKIDDVLNYVKGILGEIPISADAEQNVLYYSGARVNFERIKKLVSVYDVMPYQLLVRLYMIDIKSNASLNAGTDWLVESGRFSLGQSELIYPLTGGINSMLSVGNIKSFFSFLEKNFDARVVSRPYLYMKSGQSAKIQIGSEIPFITSKTSQSTVSTGIVQNVQYRGVGMIFKLTSTVTDSEDIIMDVTVENSAIQPGAGVENNPIFTSDNLETKFIVHDKSLTILGGIKFTERKKSQNGFPFLDRVPVLKYIFGTVDRSYEGREMLIAICPKILDSISTREFGSNVFKNISELLDKDLKGDKKNGDAN